MKRMLKKSLAFILALTMVFGAAPLAGLVGLEFPSLKDVFADKAEAATHGALTYEVSNGKVTITDCDTSASGELVIPSSIEGYPVTSIGYGAFRYCTGLTSVIIPDSVTSIGDYAFYYCTGLTSITIPNSVAIIGDKAFYGCTGLTSITIPNSVAIIGDKAFYGCTGLTSITIPDSVTSIGGDAFYACTGLTSVTIGNSVTSIGDRAFSQCTGLTSVIIGNGVTSIGYEAFRNCTGLTNITIGNGVTSIVPHAFENCTGLTNVTIPDSVTNIDYSAFRGCTALADVYYAGSEDEWNAISISSNNENLTNATIHFNSSGGGTTPEILVSQNIKVMSYNVYVYNQNKYSYGNRAKYISSNILEYMPDSVGLQEITEEFLQKIKTVPDISNRKIESYYNAVGEYRNGDKADGGNNEGCLILYNKNKYELLDSDTFWLSETPDEVSYGWEANEYRRVCTYAVLKDKVTNSIYAHFNTHLDHNDKAATNSVKLITDYIREHYPNIPIVFTGDFNHKEQTTVYQMVNNGGFLDSKTQTSQFDVDNTYHDYGRGNENKIIDFIFTNDFVTKVKCCEVYDRDYSSEGLEIKYASDHHPVVSEISFECNNVLIKTCSYCGETFSDKNALKLHVFGGLCSSYIDEGKDNFSFINAESQGGFDGVNYSICDEYKDILLSKYNFAARRNIKEFIASAWNGSCLGMSCVIALMKAQKLNPNYFDSYALNAYSLTAPYYSDTTESLVNFYHVQQLVKPLSKAREFNSNESVNLKKLVDSVTESKFPVVIGFDIREVVGGARYGGHSVVAYGIEQDGDYYKIYISDPNKDCYFLFIKTDYSDAYFTDNTGTKGSYYWDDGAVYDSFVTWSIKVEDSSESYNHINIQEELLLKGYSSGNIELMSYEESPDFFMMNVNYQDFVITCSDGTFAKVENGNLTSGTLELKYYGAQNEAGAELKLMYSLPVLDSGETYTISPISEAGKLYYSSSVLCDSSVSFFISAKTNECADIVVSSDGGIRTNCISETEQTITVSRSDASSKWYSVSVNGSAKSLDLNQSSAYINISSDELSSAEITVSNDFNNVTFSNVSLSSSPIKVYDTTNGITFITKANGEVVDSAKIGNAVIFYSLGGTSVNALCNIPNGEKITAPVAPTRNGYLFDGWYTGTEFLENQKWNFDTYEVSADTRLYAKWIDVSNCNITIKNNSGSKTISYGETLRLTAVTTDMPENAKIEWYVDGVKKDEGETFEVSPKNGSIEITVKIVDANGNVLIDKNGNEIQDSEKVSVNSGLWQKIVSFFKNLFRMNRTVVQAIFNGII